MSTSDRGTLLIDAVERSDEEMIISLLKRGADPNAKNKRLQYILSDIESTSIARLLIDYGANVNVNVMCIDTPLLNAIRVESIDLVQLYMAHGACMDK